jgi:hypothetical protein
VRRPRRPSLLQVWGEEEECPSAHGIYHPLVPSPSKQGKQDEAAGAGLHWARLIARGRCPVSGGQASTGTANASSYRYLTMELKRIDPSTIVTSHSEWDLDLPRGD